VIVPLDQPDAKVAIHLLEPEAPDSLVSWGFFNAIFEQKEYAEHYVLERMAREMLEADPKLREEFETRVRTDRTFASDARARLYFFYQRSPYWDDRMNVYPVGRITKPLGAKTEPLPARTGERGASSERPAAEVIEQRWPDGTLRLRRGVLRDPDGTTVNHGRYVRWYDNGQQEYEATFIHGKKEGTTTQWHRNGQKWTEQHYVDGKRHGAGYTWDENGVKRKEEHHVHGRPDGVWTIWGKNGRIKGQSRFDDGVPQP
jgi:hypothetical protein